MRFLTASRGRLAFLLHLPWVALPEAITFLAEGSPTLQFLPIPLF